MPDTRRLGLALACLAAAAPLAGCLTPHAKPHVSAAVLDARAHRHAQAGPACPQAALGAMSPLQLGFAFDESTLDPPSSQPLAAAAEWLACHPAPVVVEPEPDTTGTEAEKDQLARKRAEVVRTYLTAHGVAADRIRIAARGEAAPSGDIFLIRAEGRRW